MSLKADSVAIGRKIAFYRIQKGYTQAQLGTKTNMSADVIGRLENGSRICGMSLEKIVNLTNALELPMGEIVAVTDFDRQRASCYLRIKKMRKNTAKGKVE